MDDNAHLKVENGSWNPAVYLVFVEGAGHPVPQRAELPPHLGALLHLLCPVLLVFISDQGKTYEASAQTARVKADTALCLKNKTLLRFA